MKKILSGALVLALLVCIGFAFAAAGSSSDPLVSKDYVDNTFSDSVAASGRGIIDSSLSSVYSNAIYALTVKALGSTDYSYAEGYDNLALSAGKYVLSYTGGSFVVASGSADAYPGDGTIIDVTSGSSVSNGAAAVKGHRNFAGENTTAVYKITSSGAFLVNGYYVISDSADLPDPDPDFRPFDENTFTDVKSSDWYYSAVGFVYSNYIFNGLPDGSFGVSGSITRADFVTALYRMAGSPSVSASSSFSDVRDSSIYYYAPVVWASENGIVLGNGDGTFAPGSYITREQMMAFMYRYAKFSGDDMSVAYPDRYDGFTDRSSVSSWAVDSVKWAIGNAIINGSDNKILPGGSAQRAQVAQVIFNFYEHMM